MSGFVFPKTVFLRPPRAGGVPDSFDVSSSADDFDRGDDVAEYRLVTSGTLRAVLVATKAARKPRAPKPPADAPRPRRGRNTGTPVEG